MDKDLRFSGDVESHLRRARALRSAYLARLGRRGRTRLAGFVARLFGFGAHQWKSPTPTAR